MPPRNIKCVYEILFGENRYVGSTLNFKERKRCHKTSLINPSNKDHNGALYKFIRENGFCWDNLQFNILEEFDECSEQELRECEKKYIRIDFESLVNVQKPGRTDKEYREENKKKIATQKKKWCEENKEKLAAHKNEKIQCDCGKIISRSNKAQHEKSKFHLNYIAYCSKFIFIE